MPTPERALDPQALRAVAQAMGRDVPADLAPSVAAALQRMLAEAEKLHRRPLGQTPPASAFRVAWE